MGYGKYFASTFTGSMFGAGAHVFAVWGYVIANAIDSTVELNPVHIAAMIGTDAGSVTDAISFLCQPDSNSRNKDLEGRRLVHESGFQYHVTSHARYRAMRNDDERKAYNRLKKQESRARLASRANGVNNNGSNELSKMSAVVSHGQPPSAITESEPESINRTKRESGGRFAPPSLPEVEEFVKARGLTVDPVKFFSHYESIGWKVGKNPMKKWKMALLKWSRE